MEYEIFARYPKEDLLDKEGQELKLTIRDTQDYIHRPVRAKLFQNWAEGMDKVWILDPLGRPFKDKPAGIQIIKVEDDDKLVDPSYHVSGIKV